MTPIEIAAAATVLALAVSAGLVTHELAHAAALRAAGVPYRIDWFPGEDTGVLGAGLRGRWAAVRPRATAETPVWVLRCSAMMPLALAVPFAAVPLGVVADPFATDGLVRFAAVGWMACALPSPQDFSVLWYADAAVTAPTDDTSTDDASTDDASTDDTSTDEPAAV